MHITLSLSPTAAHRPSKDSGDRHESGALSRRGAMLLSGGCACLPLKPVVAAVEVWLDLTICKSL